MSYWWDGITGERYWTEITDRGDVGVDLNCPEVNESGRPFWSYDLIKAMRPGDIVFHYYTPIKAFVGASVVGFPLKKLTAVWVPRGSVGRAKSVHVERSGWLLPLIKFVETDTPLTLEQLLVQHETTWIYNWIDEKEKAVEQRRIDGETQLKMLIAAPFQRYGKDSGKSTLRANQGYLTKMPVAFVDRWEQLLSLTDGLLDEQEEQDTIQENIPLGENDHTTFSPKSSDDYVAYILKSSQRRSRKHESLMNKTAELLKGKVTRLSNPFPVDLLMSSPIKIIFEGKVVLKDKPIFAVRQAVGQLFEYQHFLNHSDARLCILLDANPGKDLIDYIELQLELLIAWLENDELHFGPVTASVFVKAGLAIV